MPDRAVIQIHFTSAPIYKRRICSAYALHDFDSAISLCEREPLYLSDTRQIQWTVIDSPDTETFFDDCGRQYFALGGRGMAATALLIFGTATALKKLMDFDSVVFNMMAFLLSAYDTDRHYDGMAVIELVGLNFLITRLG